MLLKPAQHEVIAIAGMLTVQMRLAVNNTNPFELEKPNAPQNPFTPSSCDKLLNFFRLQFVKGTLSIHGFGKHVRTKTTERRCVTQRKMETRGRKQPVSNPLKHFLIPSILSSALANCTSSSGKRAL